MKKKLYLIALTILLSVTAFNTQAATLFNEKSFYKDAAASMTKAQKEARLTEIKARVLEIKAMDRSHLNKMERKELKAELRSMKSEASALSGGDLYLIGSLILFIIFALVLII